MNYLNDFKKRTTIIQEVLIDEYYGNILFDTIQNYVSLHFSNISENKLVLIIQPMFLELERSSFFISKLCRSLAFHGYTVIKFDFYGSGNSNGQNEDIDLETIQRDIVHIIKWIEDNMDITPEVSIGVQFGADLICINHSLFTHFSKKVFIHPLINVSKYFARNHLQRFILNQYASNGKRIKMDDLLSENNHIIHLDGYSFNSKFVKSLLSLKSFPEDIADKNILFLLNKTDKFIIQKFSNFKVIKPSAYIGWEDENIVSDLAFQKQIGEEVFNFLNNF